MGTNIVRLECLRPAQGTKILLGVENGQR